MIANGEISHEKTRDDLPLHTSPALELDHPTNDECLEQQKLNGKEWRGALTIEAYLRREAYLGNQDSTRNGGMTYWALVDTNTSPRRVLASCETHKKKAYVWSNGKLKETVVHGIGSVFCPPQFRRRGYAGRMMLELGQALKKWQGGNEEGCAFSILFSDIGKTYYAKHGWETHPAAHISIPAKAIASNDTSSVRPLFKDDLANLCEIDEQQTVDSMKRQTWSENKNLMVIAPTLGSVRWHHAREEFVSNELGKRCPDIKGGVCGEEGSRVWCYFQRSWYNEDPANSEHNTVHILRTVVEGIDTLDWENGNVDMEESERISRALSDIYSLACTEARTGNLAEVEIWNPNHVMVSAAKRLWPDAKVEHRDKESIPCLKWNWDREENLTPSELVHWLGNEKYNWC